MKRIRLSLTGQICENIAINDGSEAFEQFFEPLKQWYKVNANSLEKGTFITFFTDITIDKNRIKDF